MQIVKIYPGSSMVSRKVPCIFYEELVRRPDILIPSKFPDH
jgi:hypothetical protein